MATQLASTCKVSKTKNKRARSGVKKMQKNKNVIPRRIKLEQRSEYIMEVDVKAKDKIKLLRCLDVAVEFMNMSKHLY